MRWRLDLVTRQTDLHLRRLGDPCIVSDTSGNFYYSHLSNTGVKRAGSIASSEKSAADGGDGSDGSFTANEDKDQLQLCMAYDPAPSS